jgi:RNA polymerase sigma-70 factor, ECF subfamily
MDREPRQVTQLLREWSRGNESVFDELSALVYDELHQLAAGYMRREKAGHTLQPTALLHEAYLRLTGQEQPEWENRAQFFSFAAHLMRQILVDHARTKAAAKRGGDWQKVPLEEIDLPTHNRTVDLLALDEALDRLAAFDQRKTQILELRFFSGMTEEEIGAALGISVATIRRDLRVAEAWLERELRPADKTDERFLA